MKTMTCKQLGGACDFEFRAETFEEIAALSKSHGKQMFRDPHHAQAMNAMFALMSDPKELERWMQSKRAEFDSAPSK